MTEIIDISIPIQEGMVVWPDSGGVRLRWVRRIEGGSATNNSVLEADVHAGTHIDAPLHFIHGGASADQAPLGAMVGAAFVADLTGRDVITARDLDAAQIPADTERLLVRTRNSELWAEGVSTFDPTFTALKADAARWVADRGLRLVGIDYLSVQCYDDGPEVHEILLGAGVVILEGLNLHEVRPGPHELLCLPIRLVGAEGAPARAVLRTLD